MADAPPAAQSHSSPAVEAPGTVPLAGLKVLDLSQVVAGPFCSQMLASLGADVVKVEPPQGDDLRSITRYQGREAHEDFFNANNHSKRSIVLNLKRPEHLEVGRALAGRADVMLENFAPGTAERLGMGWRHLHPLNPRLIYCSISGFGQEGPSRNRVATDPIIQAVSGVMSVTGEPGRDPIKVGAPLGDVIAGMYGAFTIVSAWHAVKADGQGRYIDISLQAAMVAALGPRMGEPLHTGNSPGTVGNQNPMRVPGNAYKTADGSYIQIIVHNERHWPPVCRALGREAWIDDPRFATNRQRVAHRAEIDRLFAERLAERTTAEWMALLDKERVPAAPVNNYAQALADAQIAFRGQVRELEHLTSGTVRVVGPPWIMTGP